MWTASYGGDENNAAVAGPCNDANEKVFASRATPTLMTSASGTVALGGQISDTATVSGAFNGQGPSCRFLIPADRMCADGAPPGPEVDFAVYGPHDPGCTRAPVFTYMARVNGITDGLYVVNGITMDSRSGPVRANGTYTSTPFTPTAREPTGGLRPSFPTRPTTLRPARVTPPTKASS